MATYTTNYNLKKPADSDFINIADLNGNADIIDEELKKRPVVGSDGKLPDNLLPDLSETYEEKGAAGTAVSAHNTSPNAHNDIRVELDKKATKTAVSAHNTSPDAHNDIRVELGKKAPVPIIGATPPTTSTVGVVGQEYIDKTNKRVWYCTAAESTGYTWILTSAGLSTKVNITLSASGWSTEKKYTVSNANITATSAVELLPRENNGITQAQMEALSGAMIVGGTQAAGSIQLVALGDKPTTDIPVTLIIRRDL